MRSLMKFVALATLAGAALLAAGTARAQIIVTPSYYADGQYVCSYYYPFTCPDGYAAKPAYSPAYGDAGDGYADTSNQYADTGYGYVANNVYAGGGYGNDYSDAAFAGSAYPCDYPGADGYGYAGCGYYGYGPGVAVGIGFDRFHRHHDFDRRFDHRVDHRHFVGHDNYIHRYDRRGFIHAAEHRGYERRDFGHRGFEHRGDDRRGFERRGFAPEHGGMARPVHFNAPHPIGGGTGGGGHGGGNYGHRH